jgi:hypothetical protein
MVKWGDSGQLTFLRTLTDSDLEPALPGLLDSIKNKTSIFPAYLNLGSHHLQPKVSLLPEVKAASPS